ncbi:DNA N-6-adenine-methyltransferase [Lutispora sp.]|uniref:DNA N-6-adenine-methyltransferase n=1 Tax=Lutispora sp. TaxID=2828727 RepID=UPI002B1EFC0D|nr:DNA N-6-adenine-methyltransferase [Lutispora sp.]MEA4960369.1 DNA N-6-adenine-methyltransferase [Lutispora sp.]
MNNELMFSSKTDLWATPQWLYDELHKEFNFQLDAACNRENCKCYRGLFIEKFDGLQEDWYRERSIWLNPPYGRQIGKWVKKAYVESQKGCTVVCLLPARTDTKWFHDYIYNKAEIRFIKGRLKFGGHENAAPFPSMIVIFRPKQAA